MNLYKGKYKPGTRRLHNWDYGRGYYFITICTRNKVDYFGHINNGQMRLSDIGNVAHSYWESIPKHFPFTKLGAFVIMPDHMHGIIIINNNYNVDAQNVAHLQYERNVFGPQSCNLGSIIRGYKAGVKKYAVMNNINFHWQHRYYDHIIRDDQSLQRIRQYIHNNPSNWADAN